MYVENSRSCLRLGLNLQNKVQYETQNFLKDSSTGSKFSYRIYKRTRADRSNELFLIHIFPNSDSGIELLGKFNKRASFRKGHLRH